MRLFLFIFLLISTFSSVAFSAEVYVASSLEALVRANNKNGNTHSDASSRLASQILAGANADLFISANKFWAMEVHQQYGDFPLVHLANNRLVVATKKDSAKKADDICQLKLGAVMPEIPAGTYADIGMEKVACKSELMRAPSLGVLRAWIKNGDVDAGFIYASDLITDNQLKALYEFSSEDLSIAIYALPLSKEGARWVEKVNRPTILTRHGFSLPEKSPKRSSEPTQLPDEIKVLSVLWHSALVGILVVILALLPAIFLGFVFSRWNSKWKVIVSMFTLAPLVLPPVVTGLFLLKAFGKGSVLAPLLDVVGTPAFTWFGALLASLTVSFPLFVVMTRRAFESINPEYELVALTCGASRWEAFRRVSLPLATPGILAGAMLTFARSLGEFGATAVFAGNLAADGGTISLAIYRSLQTPNASDLIWVLSLASILLSLIAIGVYEFYSAKQKRISSGGR